MQNCVWYLQAPSLPPGYIPDVPISPIEDLTTSLPELNALGEPTLQSLGLGGNGPAGLVQQLLEILHVSLDIPWWGAIGLGMLIVTLLYLFLSIPVNLCLKTKPLLVKGFHKHIIMHLMLLQVRMLYLNGNIGNLVCTWPIRLIENELSYFIKG